MPDAVDSNQEPLFEAPDPAPGTPLLTDSDTKYLSSFFEDMTASQYSMPSFGEGLNFSDAWLDLPPQFMGTAATFATHPSSLDHAATSSFSGTHHAQAMDVPRTMTGSRLMPPPPPPSHARSYHDHDHPDDVLNAAATLLHNGNPRGSTVKMSDPSLARRAVGYPVGHLRHQPLEEFREETRRSSLISDTDHAFTEWAWGPKENVSQRKAPLGDFQWGSDANFGPAQGYVPDANKESVQVMQQTQLKCLECLEVSKSAVNTCPASPVNGRDALESRDGPGNVKSEEDQSAPPRKRRKSRNTRETGDEYEDDDDRDSCKTGRKRRSRTEQNMSPQSLDAESDGRRRKSNASTSKAPRENLSEDQKRENHIRSEQKRRTLIKEGFDDLGELVPGLKGGGFSKSTTLAMAAKWLEELLRGNKALSAQLVALNGKAT